MVCYCQRDENARIRRDEEMRQEATIEEWGTLYQIATKVKELKPWETFCDMDLFCIRKGKEEDAAFISILGNGGSCYGIVVYEGYEGLNDFLMLVTQERMNLSTEFAMYSQNNLTCYWGDRDELSEKQRKVIKELGYKFRGKNQWLYFISYAAGYFPCNFDRDEVLQMTEYMTYLVEALEYYNLNDMEVDFASANMFCGSVNPETGIVSWGSESLPFTSYKFGGLVITNEALIEELKNVSGNRLILEADIAYLGAEVVDKKYARPTNPRLCLVGEAKNGIILTADMTEPEEDANISLAESIVKYILNYGAPKEIRVSNDIVGAALASICEFAGIKLRRVKKLPALDDFVHGMQRFR